MAPSSSSLLLGTSASMIGLIVDRHPSIAAALPRASFTVANSMSPATKNSTVDKMASR
jgi:hypothetical protein